MPAFRNLNRRQQGRSSARLENRVPVAYDKEGWEVPVGETLQSLCLSRGSSPHPIPNSHHERVATSPSRQPHPTKSEEIMTSVPPSARTTRPRSASVLSTASSATASCSSPPSKRPSPTMPSKARSKPYSKSGKGDDHVRRPRNAFIFFRSHYNELLAAQRLAEGPKTNQNTISKDAGKVWNDLPESEKKYFKELANAEKAEHRRNHPGYRYAPHGSKSGKSSASKAKSTSRAKKARKAIPDESDDEADPGFGADVALATVASAPRRSLRARPTTRRYPSPSPSPSPRSISPTPSASSSLSTQESVDEALTEREEEFVPTENIPHLALSPHESKEEQPTLAQILQYVQHVDRHQIPAFMDNTKEVFGVDVDMNVIKTHAWHNALDAFLGDSSPVNTRDMDAGLPSEAASIPEAGPSSFPLHQYRDDDFSKLMEQSDDYDAAESDTWGSSELSASAKNFMDMFLDTSMCESWCNP